MRAPLNPSGRLNPRFEDRVVVGEQDHRPVIAPQQRVAQRINVRRQRRGEDRERLAEREVHPLPCFAHGQHQVAQPPHDDCHRPVLVPRVPGVRLHEVNIRAHELNEVSALGVRPDRPIEVRELVVPLAAARASDHLVAPKRHVPEADVQWVPHRVAAHEARGIIRVMLQPPGRVADQEDAGEVLVARQRRHRMRGRTGWTSSPRTRLPDRRVG